MLPRLLHTGSDDESFSMFTMGVKAEGDFADVKVCHQAPLVKCGIGIRYSPLRLTLAGEVPHAISRGRVLQVCASSNRGDVEVESKAIRCNGAPLATSSRPRYIAVG